MGLGRGVSTLVALGSRAAALFGGRLRMLLLEGQALGSQGSSMPWMRRMDRSTARCSTCN
jgi:hypothetical protein